MPAHTRKASVAFTRDGFAALIGAALADKFISAFGGVRMRIPRTEAAQAFIPITDAIGVEAARKVVAEFGGESAYLNNEVAAARESRNREIRTRFDELTSKGRQSSRKAVFVLSREYSLSDRSIERIVNTLPK